MCTTGKFPATAKSRPLGEGGIAVGDDGRGHFRANKLCALPEGVKLPPSGELARERLRGFSILKETSKSALRRAFQIVWHNRQKPRRAVCSAGLLSIGKEA